MEDPDKWYLKDGKRYPHESPRTLTNIQKRVVYAKAVNCMNRVSMPR